MPTGNFVVMKLLVWHVHGSWTTAFVQGEHTYLLPTVDDRGPWGRGRCGRPWPDSAVEVPPDELREADIDAVVLQRPEEIDLTVEWLGSRPGTDLPAVYVEHNTPRGHAANSRHPLADQDDIAIVHVTHYNELMWDNGIAPTVVIEHGVLDPGHRYTGELARAAVLINEPVRRGRIDRSCPRREWPAHGRSASGSPGSCTTRRCVPTVPGGPLWTDAPGPRR